MLRISKPLLLLALLITLSACSTLNTVNTWPQDLPPRTIFVADYVQKHPNIDIQQQVLETHLAWIKRFYQGTLLYPNGWLNVSDMFLANVDDPRELADLTRRVRTLGILISTEWSQENAVRNIDNTNMAIWASALREAANRKDHSAFMSKVESDVGQLIAGTLQAREIAYERYYPDEDYDNF